MRQFTETAALGEQTGYQQNNLGSVINSCEKEALNLKGNVQTLRDNHKIIEDSPFIKHLRDLLATIR